MTSNAATANAMKKGLTGLNRDREMERRLRSWLISASDLRSHISPNENKMSDGGRARASIGMGM